MEHHSYLTRLRAMDLDDQLVKRVIMGAIIVMGSWKSYLIFRNSLMLRKLVETPPELDLDSQTFERISHITQIESERLLFITVIDVNIKLAKMVFGYFPYIWEISGEYGKTLVTQTMWFAAIDNCVEVAAVIPLVFVNSLLTGQNILLAAIDQAIEVVFRGLLAALSTYLIIYVTDHYGVSSIVKVQVAVNVIGVLLMAFYMRFLMAMDHERLKTDNETGRTIAKLAKDVGYPVNTIFVDKFSPEPNAYYTNAIFSNVIIITESLINALDAALVTSVVAHELGHWKYRHPWFTYLGHTINMAAMGIFWIFAYGNPQLTRVFQLDPGVHPFVPVYLAFYFIWPPVKDFTNGLFNLLKTSFEFVADDYASSLWSPETLRLALVKISSKIRTFPLLDSWFAAWFVGHPSILQRIRRIDVKLRWFE